MQSAYLFFEGITPRRIQRPPRSHVLASTANLPNTTSSEPSAFLASLFDMADLPVAAYRRSALSRRLPACLRYLRAKDSEHASSKIGDDRSLAAGAMNVVLLGVTEFFRDAAVFEHLGKSVLPVLLTQKPRLRIWSAACSGGQELYSVAMMLAELGRLDDCELLGTDFREEGIEQARNGIYATTSLLRMDRTLREKYFAESGSSAEIHPGLRTRSCWRVADLLRVPEAGPWQLILWRNMAIYLEADAADGVWEQLCDALEPGGFIIGGKADHPPKYLPLRRVGPCTYQKRSPCKLP